MRLPKTVYHEICRRWHELFHARDLIAVGIGVYMGWVRCAGVVLHVYGRQRASEDLDGSWLREFGR